MTTRRALSAICLLTIATSCSYDPVGTYVTTPESFKRALEATLPQDDSPAAVAIRERAVGFSGNATLNLEAGGDFVYTVEQSEMAQPWVRKGTWEHEGERIRLQPEGEPEPWLASLGADAITLQENEHAPRFVLEKKHD